MLFGAGFPRARTLTHTHTHTYWQMHAHARNLAHTHTHTRTYFGTRTQSNQSKRAGQVSLAYEQLKMFSSLAHGKKIISEQGIDSFKKWLDDFKSQIKDKFDRDILSKKQLIKSKEFKELEDKISGNTDGNIVHPKSLKLSEILQEFFDNEENIQKQSRIMVFTQNKVNAIEIKNYISQNAKVHAEIFVGQNGKSEGVGISQKQQIEIIKKFKSYTLNTLIATCIGEEGLDIGEVDLIICYDSGFSPIRMIQRMGRTGRKRTGKVIILLMEGKEYNSYIQSQKKNKRLKQQLKMNSRGTRSSGHGAEGMKNKNQQQNQLINFYSFNPRMVPDDVTPQLQFLANKSD